MKLKQIVSHRWNKLKNYPKKYTITSSVLVLITALYASFFFIASPVNFSYSGTTCVEHLTLFPGIHKATSEANYKLTLGSPVKIGTTTLASRSTCFTPTVPPMHGSKNVSIAPFGGLLLRKTFAVSVAAPATVNAIKLSKPIPASRPLILPLSTTDTTFTYYLRTPEAQVKCASKEKAVSCDVQKFKLDQGKPHPITLTRQFGSKRITTMIKKTITTLPAVHVAESSVKPGEVIYSKPRTIDLVFDKDIAKADPLLYRIEGEKRSLIKTTTARDGKKLQLTTPEELPRASDYEVSIDTIEASDGSGLEAPYKLSFKTSGGPAVTHINIGKTGVIKGATAIITFDQALSEAQDSTKIVTTSGGAVVSGKKGNQLFVALGGVPKCGDFSIKIAAGLTSNYDVASTSTWNHTSRIICHSIETIGYSHSGRAIAAYYFGSGPRTVLYTGAIHGNEMSTKYLMDSWINDLEVNARNIPADKTIVVVPQLNPDGVAKNTRVNARNVDLNRNFATSDWSKDITTVNNQPFPGGGGESPMSEPETQAIAGLAQRLRPGIILSYHSQGSVVAANQAGSSNTLASTYSQLSGYRNTTGQSGTTFEYAISGTADDWYAEKLGTASILIELGSHSSSHFSRNQKAMWTILNS